MNHSKMHLKLIFSAHIAITFPVDLLFGKNKYKQAHTSSGFRLLLILLLVLNTLEPNIQHNQFHTFSFHSLLGIFSMCYF